MEEVISRLWLCLLQHAQQEQAIHIPLPITLIQTLADWRTRTVRAYSVDSLMLAPVDPFATRENHMQSQGTPLCDEETTSIVAKTAYSDDLLEVLHDQMKANAEAWGRYASRICTAKRRYETESNTLHNGWVCTEVGPVRREAAAATDRRVEDRVPRGEGDCQYDPADSQPLRPFFRIQPRGGRSAGAGQTTRRSGTSRGAGQRSEEEYGDEGGWRSRQQHQHHRRVEEDSRTEWKASCLVDPQGRRR